MHSIYFESAVIIIALVLSVSFILQARRWQRKEMQMPVACTRPWDSLEIHEGGEVKVCCWTKMSVGNIQEQSLMDIWNGEPLQIMRRNMLAGNLERMCRSWCPALKEKWFTSINLSSSHFNSPHQRNKKLLASEIKAKKTIIQSFPLNLRLFPTERCNIACVMCLQDHQNREWDRPVSEYGVDKLIPYLQTIQAVGGEPLVSTDFRKFVADFSPVDHPDCRLQMLTNGLLLDNQFLDLMPGRFSWVGVSVDGATKETFERIRVGASWETLLLRLQALADLKGRDFEVTILFTVMRSNYHELIKIRDLANSFGFSLGVSPVHEFSHGEQIEQLEDVQTILNLLRQLQNSFARVLKITSAIYFYEKMKQLMISVSSSSDRRAIYQEQLQDHLAALNPRALSEGNTVRL